MTIQEVDVLTTFYCDRMEDEESTEENITGLSALQKMSGFGQEEVTKVCDAYGSSGTRVTCRLFNEMNMTKHPQSTRLSIYTLIDSMMKKQRKGMLPEDKVNPSTEKPRQAIH
jgi:hypothetical protein